MTLPLSIVDASISYGATEVVHEVSLTLAPGEIHVLLGRSGSGKSTLLRAVAGFERLRRGRLEVAGRVVDDGKAWVPPERRGVGLVFQDYALFPHLDAARNVAFGMRTGARDPGPFLELVGLRARHAALPSELSGGEQQRVALARALAARPTVLLLDEPFSNLDPSLRTELRDEAFALLRREGVASILVTHAAEEALSVADRISVIHGGRIVETASREALWSTPATLRGAEALGPVVQLPARSSGGGRARTALGELVLAHAPQDAGVQGTALLRPDSLRIVSDGDEGVLARRVRSRFRGGHTEVDVEVGGVELTIHCRCWERPSAETIRIASSPGVGSWMA